jgi:50S ribosomal protein L16 3-hydroxylase
MDTRRPTPLLGGLSPAAFMRRTGRRSRSWCAAALPIRCPASTGGGSSASPPGTTSNRGWSSVAASAGRCARGQSPRRALPPLAVAGWSLLVQGVDLHDDAAHALLQRFRFVPDARLDDVMVSYASDGGGVGPHIDSYDVFLLQLAGRRRWRIGRVARPRLRDDVPLKMLDGFKAAEDWLLDPGDMLYLPPGWGHDGIAVGDCLTASIGFRAPAAVGLAADTLQRLADAALDALDDTGAADRARNPLYTDREQPADRGSGAHPRVAAALCRHGDGACHGRSAGPAAGARRGPERAKPGTWFERAAPARLIGPLVLDRKSRHALRRRHRLPQRRGVSCRRPGCHTHARLRRRPPAGAGSARPPERRGRGLLERWVEDGWCRAKKNGQETAMMKTS